MSAHIVNREGNELTIQFTVKLTGSMLDDEQALQESLNEAGCLTMVPMIEQFDTKGEVIRVNGVKHTAKQPAPEKYQTPYGQVKINRYIYQNAKGGRTYVPLEVDARMVLNSTPRYAKIVTGKYTRLGANALQEDLWESNGRRISHEYAKDLSDFVGTIAQCRESDWEYDLPELEQTVSSVSISLDGTCMLMHNDGWREAMCGSISLYSNEGDRLHTIYCGATPEYGKEKFKKRLTREIQRVKERFPDAFYLGLADGAKDNWIFLKQHTTRLLLDFYHAREYIAKAAAAIFGRDRDKKKAWEEEWSHLLKHKQGSVTRLLTELEKCLSALTGTKNSLERCEEIRQVIVYYSNHKDKMNYSRQIRNNLPIGSGIIEAACKVLIKERMCISGSRWKEQGASAVLSLRALKISKGRWEQFWQFMMRYGCTSY